MAKKKKQPSTGVITNRRARFDYELGEELAVGIVLSGPEVRAARDGHIQLKGSFVTIRDSELWLNNASFSVKPTEGKTGENRTIDTRPRKLLAHRKQIDALAAHKQAGMTIVPLRLLNKGRHVKVIVSLAKGKKNYDKRETIKRREQEREARRQMKRA